MLNSASFMGVPDPDRRLREWQRLSPAAQQQDVNAFRAVYKAAALLAGAYLHPGGFLIDVFVADKGDDALRVLLRDMLEHPQAYGGRRYSLSLANFSPRLRARLSTIFTRAGYKKQLEYQVKCELIRLDELTPVSIISFSETTEAAFEATYKRLTPNPWPWKVITRRAGGGQFNPDLWLLSTAEDVLLGMNEPINNRTQGRIFNTVVALTAVGQEVKLEPLMREALRRAAAEDPLGVVNAHVSAAVYRVLEPLGFEVLESYPVFTPT